MRLWNWKREIHKKNTKLHVWTTILNISWCRNALVGLPPDRLFVLARPIRAESKSRVRVRVASWLSVFTCLTDGCPDLIWCGWHTIEASTVGDALTLIVSLLDGTVFWWWHKRPFGGWQVVSRAPVHFFTPAALTRGNARSYCSCRRL